MASPKTKEKKLRQTPRSQSARQLQLRAEAKIKAVLNAGRKKSVHISLFTTTHVNLRKKLLEREVSIQEVFEYLSSLINDEHPSIVKLLDDYVDMKKEKLINKLEEKYTENLYRLISEENNEGEIS